jgi:hypothetical protein
MVFHDRPVYQEEHAAQLIMARRLCCSPPKGPILLRRSVDLPFALPLQSCGGPYISGNFGLDADKAARALRGIQSAISDQFCGRGMRDCKAAKMRGSRSSLFGVASASLTSTQASEYLPLLNKVIAQFCKLFVFCGAF